MDIKGLQLTAWHEFFKAYAEEPINNLYVKKFNPRQSLASIVNTFLSDFLVYQCFEYHCYEREMYNFEYFLPVRITLEGRNVRGNASYGEINLVIKDYKKSIERIERILKNDKIDTGDTKTIVSDIQNAVLNDELLLGSNSSCYEIVKSVNGGPSIPFQVVGTYQAKDEDETNSLLRTDEFEYGLLFKEDIHAEWMPLQIIDPLFSIAIFTKRNKIATNDRQIRSNRNGIAKVMARNMSHNLGSHVLSRLDRPDAIDIDNIINFESSSYLSTLDCKLYRENQEKIDAKLGNLLDAYLGGKRIGDLFSTSDIELYAILKREAKRDVYNDAISYFNSYLKTRQDLLADVVSGTPQVQSSKYLYEDLISGIDRNYILLNRISGVNNFHYRFIFDGLLTGENPHDIRDLQVAVSNDVVGQHAFYIIIENIIRNTAKHGIKNRLREQSNIHNFTINTKESEEDMSFLCIEIFDDIEIVGNDYLRVLLHPFELPVNEISVSDEIHATSILIDRSRLKMYYPLADPDTNFIGSRHSTQDGLSYGYYKVEKINRLVANQNIWINQPILNELDSELRLKALGLIEMEVCAAYLRQVPIEKIEDDDYLIERLHTNLQKVKRSFIDGNKELPLLEAFNAGKEQNFLGYRFFLPKPKQLLIIDEIGTFWEKLLEEGDLLQGLKLLENSGILLLTLGNGEQDSQYQRWFLDLEKSYSQEILMVNGKDGWQQRYETPNFPQRQIGYFEVKDTFESYNIKHAQRVKEAQQYYQRKKKYIWEPFDISLDFINSPAKAIIEVYRAYVFSVFNRKKISFGPGVSSDLQKELPAFTYPSKHSPIIDSHGKRYPDWSASWGLEPEGSSPREIIPSEYDHYKNLILEKKDSKSSMYKLKFMDASLANVLIIDERIQEQAFTQSYKLEGINEEPKVAAIWNYAGVNIPSANAINLMSKTFSPDYADRIIKIIQNQFGDKSHRNCKGLDFLVIHLGVIEKMLEVTPGVSKDSNDDIVNLIDRIISSEDQHSCKVVLVSGRAPRGLPKKYSFLNYSIISQYLVDKRFKLFLHEVLQSARPK